MIHGAHPERPLSHRSANGAMPQNSHSDPKSRHVPQLLRRGPLAHRTDLPLIPRRRKQPVGKAVRRIAQWPSAHLASRCSSATGGYSCSAHHPKQEARARMVQKGERRCFFLRRHDNAYRHALSRPISEGNCRARFRHPSATIFSIRAARPFASVLRALIVSRCATDNCNAIVSLAHTHGTRHVSARSAEHQAHRRARPRAARLFSCAPLNRRAPLPQYTAGLAELAEPGGSRPPRARDVSTRVSPSPPHAALRMGGGSPCAQCDVVRQRRGAPSDRLDGAPRYCLCTSHTSS